jgi:hypothetical protein
MLDIFKKKGIIPEYTADGMLYHLSKMESSFYGTFNGEKTTTLSFLIGKSSVSLKGYGLNGLYIDETYNILGPPEYDSSTGYTWYFVGSGNDCAFGYALSNLRGGKGIVIRPPDNPYTFYWYR